MNNEIKFKQNVNEILDYLINQTNSVKNYYIQKPIRDKDFEYLEDYINEMMSIIIKTYQDLVIVRHECLIENLKKAKVTIIKPNDEGIKVDMINKLGEEKNKRGKNESK